MPGVRVLWGPYQDHCFWNIPSRSCVSDVQVDPALRPTAAEALKHPFLSPDPSWLFLCSGGGPCCGLWMSLQQAPYLPVEVYSRTPVFGNSQLNSTSMSCVVLNCCVATVASLLVTVLWSQSFYVPVVSYTSNIPQNYLRNYLGLHIGYVQFLFCCIPW